MTRPEAPPHAIQIADRWQLMHNLSEAVRQVVTRHRRWPQQRTEDDAGDGRPRTGVGVRLTVQDGFGVTAAQELSSTAPVTWKASGGQDTLWPAKPASQSPQPRCTPVVLRELGKVRNRPGDHEPALLRARFAAAGRTG
jgi:hypothetical protein